MKNLLKKIFLFLLISILVAASSCMYSDDEGPVSLSGKEDLLNGSWWVSYSGSGEGDYFDGSGAGYDLSEGSSGVYIVCSNAITYIYNGSDLNVVEHGTTRTFTFVQTGETTADISISVYTFSATRVELTAACIK